MLTFLLGMIVGGTFTFMILAIISASSLADDRERKEIEKFKKNL